MDDEPMWAANRVVASTPGSAITIPETKNEFAIKALLMHTGIAIHMMIEKKYPLTQEMLSRMLSRRLEVDQESEMEFELLRSSRESKSACGEVGGVEKMSSTGSKLIVRGEECLEGCVGAGGGEVNGGGDDFGVRKSLLGEIPGVVIGKSGGEIFGDDGGAICLKPGLQSMTSGQISSGLDLTYAPSTITTQQPSERKLDLLFKAMYDDYLGGQPSVAPRTTSAT
ncbi:hypothetical protein Tco_0940679 [Tanacetum coccineum]|uniref:Uncharacterized protein n=1 Tax=Tanacetum coccineum TaxID=301880 RepID=A0ABQ5DUR0_9ASTR